MAKTLELKFENQDGKIVTISLEKPIEPVDPAKVDNVMSQIIAQNAFTSSGGDYVKKKSARLVDHSVEEITLP